MSTPEYREGKLQERITELERRNAMLVAQLNQAGDCIHDIGSGKEGWAWEEVLGEIQDTLSATSAETEAWLQAEIVKRLWEPVWVVFFPTHRKSPDVEWSANMPISVDMKLYRLPSPLATPEERKE